jgi:hypothetical protein
MDAAITGYRAWLADPAGRLRSLASPDVWWRRGTHAYNTLETLLAARAEDIGVDGAELTLVRRRADVRARARLARPVRATARDHPLHARRSRHEVASPAGAVRSRRAVRHAVDRPEGRLMARIGDPVRETERQIPLPRPAPKEPAPA